MSSKIESLEGELEKIRANGNDGENKVKEISSKENKKMNVFKCNICQYKTDKEVTLKKHKNTKHCMFKCKECSKTFKSHSVLEEHLQKEPTQIKEADEYSSCPIWNEEFTTLVKLHEHFHEIHVEKEKDSDCYHQHMDMLLDMYEAMLNDSEDINIDLE